MTVHLIESLIVYLTWKRLNRKRRLERKKSLKVRNERWFIHRRFEIRNRRSNKAKWWKLHKRLIKRNLYAWNKINDFSIFKLRELSTCEIFKSSLSFHFVVSFCCCCCWLWNLWNTFRRRFVSWIYWSFFSILQFSNFVSREENSVHSDYFRRFNRNRSNQRIHRIHDNVSLIFWNVNEN